MISESEEREIIERLLRLSARVLLMHQRGLIRLQRQDAHDLATAVTETAFILGRDDGFWEQVQLDNKDLQ